MAQEATVMLGQFLEENAEKICQRLEDAGITWWVKNTSSFSQLFFADAWGVRVFVAKAKYEQAVAIAREVTGE